MKSHASYAATVMAGILLLLEQGAAQAHGTSGNVQWSVTIGAPQYGYPPPQYRYYAPPAPVIVYPQQPFAYGPPPTVRPMPPGAVITPYPAYQQNWYPPPPPQYPHSGRRERHDHSRFGAEDRWTGQHWGYRNNGR